MDCILSLIVPVHNTSKYLHDCMESLIQAKIDGMEIIIVNDVSTDNSMDICEMYRQEYPNLIRIMNTAENVKAGGARNVGIREANGEYIAFVDSDDYVRPSMYKIMVKNMVKKNVDLAFCQYTRVSESSHYLDIQGEIDTVGENEIEYHELSDKDIMELIADNSFGNVWGGVYKRSFLVENDLFFPEKLSYDDNYWVYLVMLYMRRIVLISKEFYCYRQVLSSIVNCKNARHHLDRSRIGELFLEETRKRNIFSRFHPIIEYLFIRVHTYNTALTYCSYDTPPLIEIDKVKNRLIENFPSWNKNEYYNRCFSNRDKVWMRLLMHSSKVFYQVNDWYHRMRWYTHKYIKRDI